MRLLLCLCAVWCLVALPLSAGERSTTQNWPEFRGPRGDGTTEAVGLPLRWSETENVVWKTPLHGRGWSSPVIWDGQVWVTTGTEDGRKLSAVCVEADSGRILHDIVVFEPAEPQYCHPTNSYASPTPAIEAGRIYVHFGAHGTACLDTGTGRIVWTRDDLQCNHFRGPGSSPILEGDLLVAQFDGFDQQYVIALDKHTGRTVWKADRDIDYGTDNGDMKKAYATPTIIESGGRRQLISPSAVATIAYDPATGKELWRVRHGGMNAAARPLFGGGLVYIAAGEGNRSLIAVQPGGSGDVSDSHIVWQTGNSVPKRPSQGLLGELLFMMNDSGVASCLDARTGEVVWRERLAGEYWASPLAGDGRIYFFSQDGRTPVVAADREFRLLAENRLDTGFNASPAVAGRALYLRTFTHLYRIEQRGD
ncbi:MAG: PQQ-binding-like beta-propeller repeat protein [Planctomycetes bacterium]|nr:PQQ-binding-like beta-propeller repeat protein [Planctomycetota bacterium]